MINKEKIPVSYCLGIGLILLVISANAWGDEFGGLPRRGDLGVEVQVAPTGLKITAVRPNSAASQAGIVPGDILLSANSGSLTGPDADTLEDRLPAGATTLRLRHDGTELTKQVNIPTLQFAKLQNTEVLLDAVRSSRGDLLRTIVTHPRNPGRVPVIFVVGWLSCDSVEYPFGETDGFGSLLLRLASQSSFAMVRVDKPGVGDSQGPACSQTDFQRELAGYQAAFESLAKYPFIDTARIFVLGLSNGAGFAPLAVTNPKVRGFIAVSGWGRTWFEHMIEHERRRLQLARKSPAEVTREIQLFSKFYTLYLIDKLTPGQAIARDPRLKEVWYDAPDGQYGRPAAFYQQLQELNLAEAWSAVDVPVLAIYGQQDYIMSQADMDGIALAVNLSHSGAAQLVFLPEANHLLIDHLSIEDGFRHVPGKFHDESVPLIVHWMQQQLSANDTNAHSAPQGLR